MEKYIRVWGEVKGDVGKGVACGEVGEVWKVGGGDVGQCMR